MVKDRTDWRGQAVLNKGQLNGNELLLTVEKKG